MIVECMRKARLFATTAAIQVVCVLAASAQSQPDVQTQPATPVTPAPSMPTPDAPSAVQAPAAPVSAAQAPAAPSVAPAAPDASVPPLPEIKEAAGQAGTIPAQLLPQDLTPWSMFMDADIIVKAVMIGLAFASLVTWTVWLAKSIELRIEKRRARTKNRQLESARSLDEASRIFEGENDAVARLLRAATEEVKASQALPKDGIKERITWRLERIEATASRRIGHGMGILATIGATAPFVGLFGTVWGIMNSFIGISKSHTTSLAVVAPGIAEALLATALGLVAAIPAVVIYNIFTRSIGGYRLILGNASANVMRLASRDLDRGAQSYARAAE
jgi:biopolymer transport protein ExbB